MTSYAFHLETSGADGRRASVWAIGPSVVTARALMSAYCDAAGFARTDILCDVGPIEFDADRAAQAGLDVGPGSSGLYCMLKHDGSPAGAA